MSAARSCPTCHSIGSRALAGNWIGEHMHLGPCPDSWHGGQRPQDAPEPPALARDAVDGVVHSWRRPARCRTRHYWLPGMAGDVLAICGGWGYGESDLHSDEPDRPKCKGCLAVLVRAEVQADQ